MVLQALSQVVEKEMELQRLRTYRVERSHATLQTAVDNAVVQKYVVVDKQREHESHFDAMKNGV